MDGCGEGLGIKLPQYPCAFLSGHPMRHCPIVAMAAPGRARRDRWRFSFRHKERTPFAITSSAWASPPVKKASDKRFARGALLRTLRRLYIASAFQPTRGRMMNL